MRAAEPRSISMLSELGKFTAETPRRPAAIWRHMNVPMNCGGA